MVLLINFVSFYRRHTGGLYNIILEVDPDFPVNRDTLVDKFHEANILARKYFWPGCHNMKPYKDLFPNANLLLKNTELVADRVIVLPTGLAMDLDNIHKVVEILVSCI